MAVAGSPAGGGKKTGGAAAPVQGSPAKKAPIGVRASGVGPEGESGYAKAYLGPDGTQEMSEKVDSHIKGVLDGSVKRFDDKTVGMMKQGLLETSKGQARQSKRSLRSELARSGAFRSGAMGKGGMEIDMAAAADYTRGVREIMIEKAKAEFDDKNTALQMAQQSLKQKADYDIGLKQIDATIESAHIQAGATLGAASISAGATRDAARMSAGDSRAASNASYKLGMANIQQRQNDLDFRAGKYFSGGG